MCTAQKGRKETKIPGEPTQIFHFLICDEKFCIFQKSQFSVPETVRIESLRQRGLECRFQFDTDVQSVAEQEEPRAPRFRLEISNSLELGVVVSSQEWFQRPLSSSPIRPHSGPFTRETQKRSACVWMGNLNSVRS